MSLSSPVFLFKQRYAGRFWDTKQMLEVLSIYHGAVHETYPKTWRYRTLIAAHRTQHSSNMFRKGYGPDWKETIRPDVVEYVKKGKLPLTALQLAAEHIRKAELGAWVATRTQVLMRLTSAA